MFQVAFLHWENAVWNVIGAPQTFVDDQWTDRNTTSSARFLVAWFSYAFVTVSNWQFQLVKFICISFEFSLPLFPQHVTTSWWPRKSISKECDFRQGSGRWGSGIRLASFFYGSRWFSNRSFRPLRGWRWNMGWEMMCCNLWKWYEVTSVLIALCHAHVGLYNNDTCLVWELLLLPSDASAATSLPSLMAPDGNTSDHSRDYVSLDHVLYGCMVWNCPMMSRSYWPLVISVCSWNNPQWNMNPKLEGVRSNEHHLYLSPSSKSIFALLSVDACLPPRTYAVILLTPTRTDIAPECKPFLLLRAS